MNTEYEVIRIIKRVTDTADTFPCIICDIRNTDNGTKMFGINLIYFDKEEVLQCKEGDIIYL